MKEIHKAAINFAYFAANFPHDFIDKVWGDDKHLADHFKEKLHSYAKNGFVDMGGFMRFFMDLGTENMIKLLDWVRDNYVAFDFLKQDYLPEEPDNLVKEFYAPSGSMEWHDPVTGNWYNSSMQQLRNPEEYNPSAEGYTPFRDE